MARYPIMFFLNLIVASVYGQTAPPEYYPLVTEAETLYKAKDYLNSGLKYSAAFQTFGGLGYSNNRYDAACSWAMADNADSAFYNLQRIVDRAGFSEYRRITTDTDLKGLHNDVRWTTLLAQIKQNKEKSEEKYNKPLLHLLDSMATQDQKWRNYIAQYSNGEPLDDTLKVKIANRNCWLTDSINYFQLKEIFAKYGFPNYDLVGKEGSSNFWLLVQHQDAHPAFQDSVLTKMKIEVDSNKASSTNYAYLLDRVKTGSGQLQVYGTQVERNREETSYVPKPVIEPDKLNERRKSVGLDSIESYIEFVNGIYAGTLKRK